jgi:concentrative nucleoside transporter, CNT family
LERVLSFVGLFGLVAVAWAISSNRRAFPVRTVLWGIGLQLFMGIIVFSPAIGQSLFEATDVGVRKLLSFSEDGARFLFQTIEKHEVTTMAPDGSITTQFIIGDVAPAMKTVAFWILPSVIFFSALMAVAYHYGLMQRMVRFFATIMRRTMGTSGAESLSAAANIFFGQTESPLVVRPYINQMTMSELHAVMVGGFATIAGGVLALYVGMLGHIDGIAGHLVTASLMSAPAALVIAKVLYPEDGEPTTRGSVDFQVEKIDINGIDALTRGTLEGLKLFWNIAAMLLVFVAVVAMFNALIGAIGGLFGLDISLELILGYIFAPFAYLMGIPAAEAEVVGMLLGKKLVLTELIAFGDLAQMQQSTTTALSERSAVITSYALCGFANFASIGIQIGGIGGIAPERRGDLAKLGFKAMIGGTIAAMMTGAVAGLLY